MVRERGVSGFVKCDEAEVAVGDCVVVLIDFGFECFAVDSGGIVDDDTEFPAMCLERFEAERGGVRLDRDQEQANDKAI